MQKIKSVKSDKGTQCEKQDVGIKEKLLGGGVDAPGVLVIWPGALQNSPPTIQFVFREGEAPKRYRLEPFILRLEELGILERLPLEEEECNCDCTDKPECSEGGCKCCGGVAHATN